MTDTALTVGSGAARAELFQLLRPGVDLCQPEAGYIDVLGEHDAMGDRPGQRVFSSRLLPAIYEKLWRPVVSRFFFGWGLRAEGERQVTMSMLALSPGDRVVDVGCGPGSYTRQLALTVGDGLTVGVDASRPMLAAAVRRGGPGNLTYLRADASDLPFASGGFDGVCSVGVIHMLEDPVGALVEMVRLLAPGGRLVVVASYGERVRKRRRGTVKVLGPSELTNVLESHGLERIEQRVVRRAQFVSARRTAEL